jgi:hypothetical protein
LPTPIQKFTPSPAQAVGFAPKQPLNTSLTRLVFGISKRLEFGFSALFPLKFGLPIWRNKALT